MPEARTGQPYEATLYHGTSAGRARNIAAGGFTLNQGVVFLTSSEGLARDYASGAVLPVAVTLKRPLVIDGSANVLDQLRARVPDMPAPRGGDLGVYTIDQLKKQGFDGIVIRYPPDLADRSAPLPARDIVRAFDPSGLQLIG